MIETIYGRLTRNAAAVKVAAETLEISRAVFAGEVEDAFAHGWGTTAIARATGLSRTTITKIIDPAYRHRQSRRSQTDLAALRDESPTSKSRNKS